MSLIKTEKHIKEYNKYENLFFPKDEMLPFYYAVDTKMALKYYHHHLSRIITLEKLRARLFEDYMPENMQKIKDISTAIFSHYCKVGEVQDAHLINTEATRQMFFEEEDVKKQEEILQFAEEIENKVLSEQLKRAWKNKYTLEEDTGMLMAELLMYLKLKGVFNIIGVDENEVFGHMINFFDGREKDILKLSMFNTRDFVEYLKAIYYYLDYPSGITSYFSKSYAEKLEKLYEDNREAIKKIYDDNPKNWSKKYFKIEVKNFKRFGDTVLKRATQKQYQDNFESLFFEALLVR